MSLRMRKFLWPALAVLVASAALVHPLPFFLDDALFYPQIAYHIVRDGHSSFSGIGATNGYHPLWMLFNVATMWAVGLNKALNLHLLVAVEIALLAFALFQANRLMERLELPHRAFGLSFLILTSCTGLFGLETHLSLLMILLWENVLLTCLDSDRLSDWLALGVISALAVLARLDNVCLIAPGLLLASGSPRRVIARGTSAAAVFLAILAPYLAFNETRFGHLVPISGSIKTGFPHFGFHPAYLGHFGQLMAIVGIASLVLSLGADLRDRTRLVLQVNGLGTLFHAACVLFFSIDPSTGFFWYYAIGIVNCTLLMNVMASASSPASRFSKEIEMTFALFSLLILLAASGRAWLKAFGINVNPLNPTWVVKTDPSHPGYQFLLADWATRNLPEGSRVLTVDFPGALAYQSDFNIVALDGLTNDFAYDAEITADGIAGFAARHRIEYYFGPNALPGESISYGQTTTEGLRESQRVSFSSPLSRKPAGVIEIDRRSMVVETKPEFGETGHGDLSLWKIGLPPDVSRDVATTRRSVPLAKTLHAYSGGNL